MQQQTGYCNQKEYHNGWWNESLEPFEVNTIQETSVAVNC